MNDLAALGVSPPPLSSTLPYHDLHRAQPVTAKSGWPDLALVCRFTAEFFEVSLQAALVQAVSLERALVLA